MLQRTLPMIFRTCAPSGEIAPNSVSWSSVELVALELADGEDRRAVDRQWRRDHVDAAAVGQAGIADRRGTVDTTADLADDPLADIEQLKVLSRKRMSVCCTLPLDFDEDRVTLPLTMMSVMSSLASSGCSGPYPSTSLQMSSSSSSCSAVEMTAFFGGDDFVDDVTDFGARRVGVEARQLRQIDRLDQRAEDHALRLVVFVGLARVLGDDERRGRLRPRAARASRPRRPRLREDRHRSGGSCAAAARPASPPARVPAAAPIRISSRTSRSSSLGCGSARPCGAPALRQDGIETGWRASASAPSAPDRRAGELDAAARRPCRRAAPRRSSARYSPPCRTAARRTARPRSNVGAERLAELGLRRSRAASATPVRFRTTLGARSFGPALSQRVDTGSWRCAARRAPARRR